MDNLFVRINTIFEWIMKFAGTNLLWVLFNFPIVYLTMSLLFVENTSQAMMIMITIAVLAPFIFFPATIAMFGVVRKWVMKDDVSLMRFYWKYYKENYKASMIGGLIISFLWVIIGFDYYYFQTSIPLISYIFILLLICLFVFTVYFCANTVHTEAKLKQSMRNAFVLAIVNPIFSFGIAIINIAILYISIHYLTFLLPFFSGSLIAFISFLGYYKVFNQVVALQEPETIN